MNTPSKPDEHDPWEELADLVGLEGGKEYVASTAPVDSPVESAAPIESIFFSDEQSSKAEPPGLAASPSSSAPSLLDLVFADDPVGDVVFDDSDEAQVPSTKAQSSVASSIRESTAKEPFAKAPPAKVESTTEPFSSSTAEPAPAASTPTLSSQDSYWDALANWNWDDSDDSHAKAAPHPEPEPASPPPPRAGDREPERDQSRDRSRGRNRDRRDDRGDDRRGRRGDDRRDRSSRDAGNQTSAPRGPAPARAARSGDDFGLGVGDEEDDVRAAPAPRDTLDADDDEFDDRTPTSSPTADAVDDSDDSAEVDEDGEPRRRRRRRRRGKGGDREPVSGANVGPTAPSAPAAVWDDSTGPEADFEDQPETPAAPANVPVEGASGERTGRPPRGKRREGRRDRGPRRGGPERAERAETQFEDEEEQEITVGGGLASPHFGEADDDDESAEPLINYDNVPSWEEAISYLLHPSTVQVESGPDSGPANPPPRGPSAAPEQPRQNRHYGQRKNRR